MEGPEPRLLDTILFYIKISHIMRDINPVWEGPDQFTFQIGMDRGRGNLLFKLGWTGVGAIYFSNWDGPGAAVYRPHEFQNKISHIMRDINRVDQFQN
jgi:hypothetical protein